MSRRENRKTIDFPFDYFKHFAARRRVRSRLDRLRFYSQRRQDGLRCSKARRAWSKPFRSDALGSLRRKTERRRKTDRTLAQDRVRSRETMRPGEADVCR